MYEIDVKPWIELLSFIGAIAASSAGLAWFISAQFSENRKLFYRTMSLHNREDDDRFEALKEAIWEILIRNAKIDGETAPVRKSFPRRRYLTEDGEVDTLS